jgi:hypothetical protein
MNYKYETLWKWNSCGLIYDNILTTDWGKPQITLSQDSPVPIGVETWNLVNASVTARANLRSGQYLSAGMSEQDFPRDFFVLAGPFSVYWHAM